MTLQAILSLILGGCNLIAIIIGVYIFLRRPQEKSELNDAVFRSEFNSLEKTVTNIRDNHLHTLEIKLDKHICDNQTKSELDARWQGRIETLLEERLPRK